MRIETFCDQTQVNSIIGLIADMFLFKQKILNSTFSKKQVTGSLIAVPFQFYYKCDPVTIAVIKAVIFS